MRAPVTNASTITNLQTSAGREEHGAPVRSGVVAAAAGADGGTAATAGEGEAANMTAGRAPKALMPSRSKKRKMPDGADDDFDWLIATHSDPLKTQLLDPTAAGYYHHARRWHASY